MSVLPPRQATDPATPLVGAQTPTLRRLTSRLAPAVVHVRWPVLVFLASRAVLLAMVWVEHLVRHQGLLDELSVFDGRWYGALALHGYPAHVSHTASTLGFFPLYPIVIRPVGDALRFLGMPFPLVYEIYAAGVIVSTIGGAVAAVLIYRLATGWWGEPTARRAVVLFCVFPGSVVFSMAYAEGLLIPLIAGCLLALAQRRWVLAGCLAGLATATAPQGLVVIPVCAVSAVVQIRRGHPRAWRSLWAPALSITGVTAFAAFLWIRTGTPLAYLDTQRSAWHEAFNPLALSNMVKVGATDLRLHYHVKWLFKPALWLFDAVALIVLLVIVVRNRKSMSIEALTWTAGISLLALTTQHVQTSPRMLLTAFPAVLAAATCVRRRAFVYLAASSAVLLLATSWVTFTVAHRLLAP